MNKFDGKHFWWDRYLHVLNLQYKLEKSVKAERKVCCFLITNLILIIIEPVPADQNRIWWVLGFVSLVSLYEVQASWRKRKSGLNLWHKMPFWSVMLQKFLKNKRYRCQRLGMSNLKQSLISDPGQHHFDIPTSLCWFGYEPFTVLSIVSPVFFDFILVCDAPVRKGPPYKTCLKTGAHS